MPTIYFNYVAWVIRKRGQKKTPESKAREDNGGS